MKRASAAGARKASRAISVASSRAINVVSPSAWPSVDVPAKFVADLQRAFEIDQAAMAPAPRRW
jgi:hypothetical protein